MTKNKKEEFYNKFWVNKSDDKRFRDIVNWIDKNFTPQAIQVQAKVMPNEVLAGESNYITIEEAKESLGKEILTPNGRLILYGINLLPNSEGFGLITYPSNQKRVFWNIDCKPA